jgi:DNA invertase Pin-like site-specific DNA recombinase
MSDALIYCRVSTEEQAEKGYSLDTQEKICRDFASRNGYTIVGVFKDDGKSGTSLNRPALQALLTRAQEERAVQAIIVQETDRLARNTIDHLTVRTLLQKADVKLISVAQPMLDDSPEGNMIDTILASVNQFQSDINSRKTKKGMQERFETGWWPACAPIGYLNKEVNGKRILVQDPHRWHLIREGLKMYLTGNYSAFEVAEILYEKGLRSLTGKKICNSIMTHILRNPFYAGMMRWNGQVKPGNHEPMIRLDEHERILRILAAHNFHASRRRVHRFLLVGFVYCGICGGRYTAELHAKRNIVYYHCDFRGRRGEDKPHTNDGQNVEASALEKEVEAAFQQIQFSDEYITAVLQKVTALYSQSRETTETQKRVLFNQRQALEQKRDIAEEKLLAGVISDADFRRLRNKLTMELMHIQDQLDEHERQRGSQIEVIRESLNLTRTIYDAYVEAPYELKRQYLALFWEKFVVQDKRIIKAIPTELLQVLLEEQKVMIRSKWLPSPKLLILLKDRLYMASVREQIAKIKHLYAHLSSSKAA